MNVTASGQHQSNLKFHGSNYFRQRIIFSTLSGKPIRIDDIRANDLQPGLKDCEANFLRLMEKMTNGSRIEINVTGTRLVYYPGVIIGGQVEHSCDGENARSLGYSLEAMFLLAPFAKTPVRLVLTGVTNDDIDPCIDSIRTITLPLLNWFGVEARPELKIVKRGYPPLGQGEILFECPIVKQLKPIDKIDMGRIKRIRGIAHAARVSPQMANRMIDGCRSILNTFIPDIYINSDVYKGNEAGKSPGYGMTLVAESTTGVLYSAEVMGKKNILPEKVGKLTAEHLLTEILQGGCCDSSRQWIMLTFMALTSQDVSRICFGRLTDHTIQCLRDILEFFGVTFRIETQDSGVILSCIGTGYVNVNKPSH